MPGLSPFSDPRVRDVLYIEIERVEEEAAGGVARREGALVDEPLRRLLLNVPVINRSAPGTRFGASDSRSVFKTQHRDFPSTGNHDYWTAPFRADELILELNLAVDKRQAGDHTIAVCTGPE